MRWGLCILSFWFCFGPLLRLQKPFPSQNVEQQKRVLDRFRTSRVGAFQDFIRFFESLAVVAIYDTPHNEN